MARGKLRIYLGAAPGVGKTYAMLSEAHRRVERGTDCVVAFVEHHRRPRTEVMLHGLEEIPRREPAYRDAVFTEMDVDAVLARRPGVALVDELAHTNVPGSRNDKRWQDVEELLAAGIDVVSTVNIQHLESGNLLDMSRLQTGTVTPIIRETDVDEVIPMALGGVPEDSVGLDVPETLPMVAVDRGLLERAVANVVENAVKYSPAGAPVLISASALADRVEVRVVDRGPGVPDEAKDRIFEPFQRYGDSPRGAGVGLGLAVARGFTEALGDTLRAEDTPGGGLTMVLSLPKATGQLPPTEPDLPTPMTSWTRTGGLFGRPTAQRTLPRGFSATGGSSGAASGAPSYPFTSPNREPAIQSWRACTISSWDRPIQFQNKGDPARICAGQLHL